jgi:hypothetical protein
LNNFLSNRRKPLLIRKNRKSAEQSWTHFQIARIASAFRQKFERSGDSFARRIGLKKGGVAPGWCADPVNTGVFGLLAALFSGSQRGDFSPIICASALPVRWLSRQALFYAILSCPWLDDGASGPLLKA